MIHDAILNPENRITAKLESLHFLVKRFPGYFSDEEIAQLEQEFLAYRALSKDELPAFEKLIDICKF